MISSALVAMVCAGVIVGVFLLAWLSNTQYTKFAIVLRSVLWFAPFVLVLVLRFKLSWAALGAMGSGIASVGVLVVGGSISGQLTEFEAMLTGVTAGAFVAFLVRVWCPIGHGMDRSLAAASAVP
jgi:hypothetical protein